MTCKSPSVSDDIERRGAGAASAAALTKVLQQQWRWCEWGVMVRQRASNRDTSCTEQRNTSHVTRHTSHVTRQTSHVTRHTSHVTCHTSHVTLDTSPVLGRRPVPDEWKRWTTFMLVFHTSHVTRHTSHVTRHTSHVSRHTSHVSYFMGVAYLCSLRSNCMKGKS